MSPDLTSARLKIIRAKELLDGLDSEVRAWLATDPCGFYCYVSPEKTRASVIVKVRVKPDTIRWSLIIADIIHNLRCALDHTMWALTLEQFCGVIPVKAEKISFPIWDTPPNSEQRRPYAAIKGKLLDAVESVQLYHDPLPPRVAVHDLAIIRDIDNANKHKLLKTVILSVGRIEVRVTGFREGQEPLTQVLNRAELKHDDEAIVLTFKVPDITLRLECPIFMAIIALVHPVANRLGEDRDDYAALIDSLITQVETTVAALVAAAA